MLAGPAIGASDFTYHRARTVDEVDDLVARYGGEVRVIAGGTDLLVQIRAGLRAPAHVVDIADLGELAGIDLVDGRLVVGASASLWRLSQDPVVAARFRALREAALCVGSLQIQSRATLVGNACNASPAADTSPTLLVYDAVVGVRSPGGRREVPMEQFWTGPRTTALGVGEWVEYIALVDPGKHGSTYEKLGRTRGVDLALVGIACVVRDGDVRVACASLGPTAQRLGTVSEVLTTDGSPANDVLDEALAADVTPISDIRASARYRLAMARVCVRRAYQRAAARNQEDPRD
ncbi:FAD binding domain-containing protein [Nocardioides conyzicola]|uniref:Xanthine dehydrogenase family protein subunit M n=1 Tax=Nocardioides conyzicola TaxID=1651781 RepID=A0ABP8X6G8_9ACTN